MIRIRVSAFTECLIHRVCKKQMRSDPSLTEQIAVLLKCRERILAGQAPGGISSAPVAEREVECLNATIAAMLDLSVRSRAERPRVSSPDGRRCASAPAEGGGSSDDDFLAKPVVRVLDGASIRLRNVIIHYAADSTLRCFVERHRPSDVYRFRHLGRKSFVELLAIFRRLEHPTIQEWVVAADQFVMTRDRLRFTSARSPLLQARAG